jgi:hypothetical protein
LRLQEGELLHFLLDFDLLHLSLELHLLFLSLYCSLLVLAKLFVVLVLDSDILEVLEVRILEQSPWGMQESLLVPLGELHRLVLHSVQSLVVLVDEELVYELIVDSVGARAPLSLTYVEYVLPCLRGLL